MNILVEHDGDVYRILDKSLKELGVYTNRENNTVWSITINGVIVFVTNVRYIRETDNVHKIRILIEDYNEMYVIYGNDLEFWFGNKVYVINREMNEFAMSCKISSAIVRMEKIN